MNQDEKNNLNRNNIRYGRPRSVGRPKEFLQAIFSSHLLMIIRSAYLPEF